MRLKIYSPTQQQEYEIVYLEVETSMGNFVILEGHAPLILMLTAGRPVTFCQQATPESFERFAATHGGILKVTRTDATLILND